MPTHHVVHSVFLVRCNHGVLPSVKAASSSSSAEPKPLNKSSASPSSLEEERRLLYGMVMQDLVRARINLLSS